MNKIFNYFIISWDVSDLIFLALFKNVAIETWMGNTHFDQISALFSFIKDVAIETWMGNTHFDQNSACLFL